MSDEFVRVGRLRDVPPGKLKQVRCAGQDVTIANVGGLIYAFDAYCPHAAWPLAWSGVEVGPPARLRCGLHGWLFDLTSGDAILPPEPQCLPIWETRVVGEHIEVRPAAAGQPTAK